AELVALPRLIGLDRADRARAYREGEVVATCELDQVARDLAVADLAEDLDHAAGILAEQRRGVLDHLGDRQRAQPPREHRADRAIGLAERDQEPLARVAVALGLERARCQARGDPDLRVVVTGEPA